MIWLNSWFSRPTFPQANLVSSPNRISGYFSTQTHTPPPCQPRSTLWLLRSSLISCQASLLLESSDYSTPESLLPLQPHPSVPSGATLILHCYPWTGRPDCLDDINCLEVCITVSCAHIYSVLGLYKAFHPTVFHYHTAHSL